MNDQNELILSLSTAIFASIFTVLITSRIKKKDELLKQLTMLSILLKDIILRKKINTSIYFQANNINKLKDDAAEVLIGTNKRIYHRDEYGTILIHISWPNWEGWSRHKNAS